MASELLKVLSQFYTNISKNYCSVPYAMFFSHMKRADRPRSLFLLRDCPRVEWDQINEQRAAGVTQYSNISVFTSNITSVIQAAYRPLTVGLLLIMRSATLISLPTCTDIFTHLIITLVITDRDRQSRQMDTKRLPVTCTVTALICLSLHHCSLLKMCKLQK